MARYTITYTSYQHNAEATAYSRTAAEDGFRYGALLFFATIGALAFYITELIALFTKEDTALFWQSLGALSIVFALCVRYFIWQYIHVEAKCNMILVNHSSNPAILPYDEAIEIIKKHKRQWTFRTIYSSFFWYIVAIVLSISTRGIFAGVQQNEQSNNLLSLSIIGLISILAISVISVLLWLKFHRSIPFKAISFCNDCYVPMREGHLCPKCEKRKHYDYIDFSFPNVAPQPKNYSSPPEDDTWVCENCKKRNKISSTKCWSCNAPYLE